MKAQLFAPALHGPLAARFRWHLRMNAAGLLAMLCLAAATPLHAQDAPSASTMAAQAGDLRIIQTWTTDPEGFTQSLAQSAPLQLPLVAKAERNQPIQQFILYGNCQRDPDDKCWLSARVQITAPDGTPYGEPLAFDALPMGSGTPRGTIGLAPGSIGLIVEDGEQLGRYRVELAVTDEIAVQTAVSVVHLDIVEAGTLATAADE